MHRPVWADLYLLKDIVTDLELRDIYIYARLFFFIGTNIDFLILCQFVALLLST